MTPRYKPAAIKPPRTPQPPIELFRLDQHLEDELELHDVRIVGASFQEQLAAHVTFERCQVSTSAFTGTRLRTPRIVEVGWEDCDFASAQWEQASIRRVEFIRCRFTGFTLPDAYLSEVRIVNCAAKLAHFRFAQFKNVVFEECDLEEADFQGADLSGVQFIGCNLSRAQLSHTKLKGTDFRSSNIEGIGVGAESLQEAIVDRVQAAFLAHLLGLDIRDIDE